MDALVSHRLSGQEYQVTLYVIRKTYGFNKVCDYISMGQIADATGINRPKVALLLKNLKEKNIIGVTKKDNTVTQKDNTLLNCLYFSKDYENWKVLPKKITVTQKDNTLLPKKITKVLPKMVHTKESIKETFTKESNTISPVAIIISTLNSILGTKYKLNTKKTSDLIHARIKEGFTVDDFKTVIDKKYYEWGHDHKMAMFLRPETLFGTKFESYLNQVAVNPMSKNAQTIANVLKEMEDLENDERRSKQDCIEINGIIS